MADALTFTLGDAEHTFDYGSLTVLEAIEMKKLTGFTFEPWIEALQKLDAEAVRFMVWLALKREGVLPEGRYSEFDFDLLAVVRTMHDDGEPMADETTDPTQAETTISA